MLRIPFQGIIRVEEVWGPLVFGFLKSGQFRSMVNASSLISISRPNATPATAGNGKDSSSDNENEDEGSSGQRM
jgi:hypothetical protein